MLQEAGFLTVARNRLSEVISDMAAAVYHFESIFIFPNSFSSQHLLMEQEDRVRVFVSLLELLPLSSMSLHFRFLSFSWKIFSVFPSQSSSLFLFLIGSQITFHYSLEFHYVSCSLFGNSNGLEGAGR